MNNSEYEQKLAESYRKKGYEITEDDLKEVRDLCDRKMKLINMSNRQFYYPLLFMDEMKNHIYRKTVNAYSLEILRISQDLAKMANDMQKNLEVFKDVCDM